jgi:hypothetical protein
MNYISSIYINGNTDQSIQSAAIQVLIELHKRKPSNSTLDKNPISTLREECQILFRPYKVWRNTLKVIKK